MLGDYRSAEGEVSCPDGYHSMKQGASSGSSGSRGALGILLRKRDENPSHILPLLSIVPRFSLPSTFSHNPISPFTIKILKTTRYNNKRNCVQSPESAMELITLLPASGVCQPASLTSLDLGFLADKTRQLDQRNSKVLSSSDMQEHVCLSLRHFDE